MFARIVDGVVAETFTPPKGIPLSDCFHADVAEQFVPCPKNIGAGWQFDGANFSEPMGVITDPES